MFGFCFVEDDQDINSDTEEQNDIIYICIYELKSRKSNTRLMSKAVFAE